MPGDAAAAGGEAGEGEGVMAEYVTLLGYEQVQTAGRNMAHAAENMQQAVTNLEGVLFRHQQFMDNWLERLQLILESHTLGEVERRT